MGSARRIVGSKDVYCGQHRREAPQISGVRGAPPACWGTSSPRKIFPWTPTFMRPVRPGPLGPPIDGFPERTPRHAAPSSIEDQHLSLAHHQSTRHVSFEHASTPARDGPRELHRRMQFCLDILQPLASRTPRWRSSPPVLPTCVWLSSTWTARPGYASPFDASPSRSSY